MADPRFRVTIFDREKNRAQQYDVERVVQALALPHGDGEAWMISFRGVGAEGIAAAIATLIDRTYELVGTEVLELVQAHLGRVPQRHNVIDYAEGDDAPQQ